MRLRPRLLTVPLALLALLARLVVAQVPYSTPRANGAVISGVVRDSLARTTLAGAQVFGEWIEFTFRPCGIDRRRLRLVTATAENSRFAVCDVPNGARCS